MKSAKHSTLQHVIAMIIGIGVNVGLGFIVQYFSLPLYLDTLGTIAVSAMTGCLWGMSVAAATHMIFAVFNPSAIFYMCISVMVSLVTVAFLHYPKTHKKRYIPLFVLLLAVISGGAGTAITWALNGGPAFDDVADVAKAFVGESSSLYPVACTVMSIGLDIVDKVITTGLAFLMVLAVPRNIRKNMWNSNWRQKPISMDETIEMKAKVKTTRKTRLGRRIFILLMATAVTLITAQTIITMKLYEDTMNGESRDNAMRAARFIAETVDGDSVDAYLNSGQTIGECDVKGYRETADILDRAYRTFSGIQYMYVYRIEKSGVRVVFDLDPDGQTDEIGERFDFDMAFEPYKEELRDGKKVPVVESEDKYGHLITAYYPIYDSVGRCVAYAGADATYTDLGDYTEVYAKRLLLILLGFFLVILSSGLWITKYFMVRPINTIVMAVEDFAVDDVDQKTLDNKVKSFREIRVQTGDEVELLYSSLCGMMTAVAEQMRDLRHYTEATAKMQNGLIITMADMVESRDSDTGAHIQKTAAYVKIILEGLKRKGYYAEKLTPKYMSDAVISAPLHDVGKINVSDNVLNKPGKLTDEEYEIMKTHTTAGREIIERAIDTVQGENYLKEARNMAAYHHERWDGKGYPEGLHGEVIPLSARVMAVADVFDALTSKRVYKPAFPLEKALEILQEGAGTQFDPKCVEAFMDSLTDVKIILKKYNEM